MTAPRVVRLDALTDAQKVLLLALINAAKSEPAPDVETGTASAEGQANDHAAT